MTEEAAIRRTGYEKPDGVRNGPLSARGAGAFEKMLRLFASARFANGRENFSEYLRIMLLEKSGYQNRMLEQQLRDVKYELRKIGTNVNQIAKKINGGFGTADDLQELEQYLKRIEKIFAKFRKEADEVW